MRSPQMEDGYVGIANELYDVLNMIKLSQYQRDAIRLVIRMSYGCRQTACRFFAWTDFEYCAGIHRTEIKRVLKSLENAKIFVINWQERVIHLNKKYETWEVEFSSTFRADRYAELVVHNIKSKFAIKSISKKLIVLVNTYKVITNTLLGISYNHISNYLIGAGVKQVETRAEVRDKYNRYSKDNKDNIKGGILKEKYIWVCKLFAKAAPGWAPESDVTRDKVEYICEFPDEQIEKVFNKARESNIHRNGLMRYVTKGLDNYGSLYERKEKADGGKDRGSGEDYRGHGRGSSKSDRGSKGGVEESRWAEIDRQLFGEDEGEQDG